MKSLWIIFALVLCIFSCQYDDISLQTITVPLNQEFTIQETQKGIINFAKNNGQFILSYDSTNQSCYPLDQFSNSGPCFSNSYYALVYFSVNNNQESLQFILGDGGTESFSYDDSTKVRINEKNYLFILKELEFEDKGGLKKETAHLLIQEK